MKLTFEDTKNRYVLICNYGERDIAKNAGFQWDKTDRKWVTPDLYIARQLFDYADPRTKDRILKYRDIALATIEQSKAVAAKADLPRPKDFDYLPYQVAGIRFMLEREGVLLGDEMGLGKTIQIIGLLNALSAPTLDGKKPILSSALIVCPASLKLNWLKELKRWLVSRLTYAVADSKFFPRSDIVIINYDILGKWLERIQSRNWDLVAADEAHYVKNPDALRSKNFYAIQGARRVLATGTPIVNRPKELFPLVHYLDPEKFPEFMPFAIRYCGAVRNGSGWNTSGASNLDELQVRLRGSIMIRRMKKEVLTELPPKTRQIIELPAPDKIKHLLKQENEQYQNKAGYLEACKAAMQNAREANDTAAYQKALEDFRKTSGLILSGIAELRKAVAIAKVPYVVEHLKEAMEEGNKVVCFAHHHEVMDAIRAHFPSSVKFSGQQSATEKNAAVERFQTDERCKLFVGGILAAGVGITLTASSHVVFAELDWVPGNLTQAEDRCHRIGQKDNVLVQHLVLEGSLDFYIAEKVIAKQKIIDAAMNNQPEKEAA